MKRTPDRPWSFAEEHQLEEIYPLHSRKEVARIMGRTLSSIEGKAKYMGLERTPAQRRAIWWKAQQARRERERKAA